MTKKEFAEKLKSIFGKRFRNAGNFKVSSINSVSTSNKYEIYSFNVKCQHKKEHYSLNYLIKFYLDINSGQQAKDEYEIIINIGKNKPFPSRDYYLDFSKDYFDKPFIIINKDDLERVDFLLK